MYVSVSVCTVFHKNKRYTRNHVCLAILTNTSRALPTNLLCSHASTRAREQGCWRETVAYGRRRSGRREALLGRQVPVRVCGQMSFGSSHASPPLPGCPFAAHPVDPMDLSQLGIRRHNSATAQEDEL